MLEACADVSSFRKRCETHATRIRYAKWFLRCFDGRGGYWDQERLQRAIFYPNLRKSRVESRHYGAWTYQRARTGLAVRQVRSHTTMAGHTAPLTQSRNCRTNTKIKLSGLKSISSMEIEIPRNCVRVWRLKGIPAALSLMPRGTDVLRLCCRHPAYGPPGLTSILTP